MKWKREEVKAKRENNRELRCVTRLPQQGIDQETTCKNKSLANQSGTLNIEFDHS